MNRTDIDGKMKRYTSKYTEFQNVGKYKHLT